MPKKEKLNLDDIDFDTALGVMDDPAPDNMVMTPTDDVEDSKDSVDEADDSAEVEETEESDATDETANDDQPQAEAGDETDADEDSSATEEDKPLVLEIKDLLGFDLGDGEFEDTPEGLVELTKAAGEKIAETQLDELFNALPDVKQYMQFRLQGGDSAQFFNTFYGEVDYGTLEVKEDDVASQEHLVRQAMALKGFDQEDINDSVTEFRNSGILHSQATKAQKGLAKHQGREKAALIEQQEREAAQAAEQTQNFWQNVEQTVKSNSEFRGIPVSEREKNDLLSFISKPVKEGLSAFQIAMNEAPVDVYLAIAALMKRDFNLEGLVARKASTQKARSLRDKLSKSNERLKSKAEKPRSMVNNPDIGDLDLTI